MGNCATTTARSTISQMATTSFSICNLFCEMREVSKRSSKIFAMVRERRQYEDAQKPSRPGSAPRNVERVQKRVGHKLYGDNDSRGDSGDKEGAHGEYKRAAQGGERRLKFEQPKQVCAKKRRDGVGESCGDDKRGFRLGRAYEGGKKGRASNRNPHPVPEQKDGSQGDSRRRPDDRRRRINSIKYKLPQARRRDEYQKKDDRYGKLGPRARARTGFILCGKGKHHTFMRR